MTLQSPVTSLPGTCNVPMGIGVRAYPICSSPVSKPEPVSASIWASVKWVQEKTPSMMHLGRLQAYEDLCYDLALDALASVYSTVCR